MRKFGFSLKVGEKVWYRCGYRFAYGEVLGFEEDTDANKTLIILSNKGTADPPYGGTAKINDVFYTEREDITPEMIQENINWIKMYISTYEKQREALQRNIDRLMKDQVALQNLINS